MNEAFGVFGGIGVMLLCAAIAWWFYQISRCIKTSSDLEIDYTDTERCALSKTVTKMGLDLERFKKEHDVLKRPSFRRRLEKRIIQDYFKGDKD